MKRFRAAARHQKLLEELFSCMQSSWRMAWSSEAATYHCDVIYCCWFIPSRTPIAIPDESSLSFNQLSTCWELMTQTQESKGVKCLFSEPEVADWDSLGLLVRVVVVVGF